MFDRCTLCTQVVISRSSKSVMINDIKYSYNNLFKKDKTKFDKKINQFY